MVHKLVLHADDPLHAITDRDAAIAALECIGLLGEPMPGAGDAWYAGEAFLSLVTFLGCAPHVDLMPVDATQVARGNFCHVRWQADSGAPQFRHAGGSLLPRCHQCRKPVPGWEPLVAAWQAGETGGAACEHCGALLTAPALNWRQSAAFGRWFLEIWNIHPHEAVPSDALQAALEAATGTRCSYFYD